MLIVQDIKIHWLKSTQFSIIIRKWEKDNILSITYQKQKQNKSEDIYYTNIKIIINLTAYTRITFRVRKINRKSFLISGISKIKNK